jgi:hypothetical protein
LRQAVGAISHELARFALSGDNASMMAVFRASAATQARTFRNRRIAIAALALSQAACGNSKTATETATARASATPANSVQSASILTAAATAPTADAASADDAGTGGAASDASTADSGAAVALDYKDKTILHCGDSMVGGGAGLSRGLQEHFKAAGAKRFIQETFVSASILTFDQQPKYRDLLARHRPDVVIITLGANDVFVPSPSSLLPFVRGIIKKTGARECYWISPPTWKPDSGIVELLKANVAPCKFFDSRNLTLPRAGDKIHPTDKGGGMWADLFWTALSEGKLQ